MRYSFLYLGGKLSRRFRYALDEFTGLEECCLFLPVESRDGPREPGERRLLGVPAQGDSPGRKFDIDLAAVRGVGLALDQAHFLEQPQGRAHGLRLDAFGAGEVRGGRRSVLFQTGED